jgi:hypothetical protein
VPALLWVFERASVFLLLCWCTVVPLLLGVTRLADLARRKPLLLDNRQLPVLAVAAAAHPAACTAVHSCTLCAVAVPPHTPATHQQLQDKVQTNI